MNRLTPLARKLHAAAAWGSLALLLLLTATAWRATDNYVSSRIDERFQTDARRIANELEKRLQEYELSLRAVAGLFKTMNGSVRLEQWRMFINEIELEQHFPGAHGIGYAMPTTHQGVLDLTAARRAEGIADFTVRPPGERPLYVPVTYLSLFDGGDPVGLGFDMLAEPTRRAALEIARDTAQPTISGVVRQPPDSPNARLGVLLFQPVYRPGAAIDTIDQRRDALLGFAFAPIRLDNLLRNITEISGNGLSMQLMDADDRESHGALLEIGSSVDDKLDARRFSLATPMKVAERTWVMYVTAGDAYILPTEIYLPLLIAIGGLIIDLLLFITIKNILSQRHRAVEIALKMTEELQQKNRDLEQFANILAHHLQEPVRLIYVFTQRLIKLIFNNSSSEIQQCLETIRTATMRERALLRDVQLYLAVGQEQKNTAMHSSVKQSAETARRHLSALIAHLGGEVTIDDNDFNVAVAGNPLLEALIALISNGLIHSRPDRSPKIHVAAEDAGDGWVKVAVADNGAGVPEAKRERVFKIFERLNNDTAALDGIRPSSGNGIGLALARRVVESVGGRIWLETSQNGGTLACFTLPLAAEIPSTDC